MIQRKSTLSAKCREGVGVYSRLSGRWLSLDEGIECEQILCCSEIIAKDFAILHPKSRILLVGHISEIRLNNAGNAVVSNKYVGLLIRLCLDVIQQIINSLSEAQRRFAALVAACEELLGLLEIEAIARGGFPLAKILLDESWLHAAGNPGQLRDVLCGVRSPNERGVEDLVSLYPFLENLLAGDDGLLVAVLRQRDVCRAADFIFKKNRQGFSVIQLPRGIAPFYLFIGEDHSPFH